LTKEEALALAKEIRDTVEDWGAAIDALHRAMPEHDWWDYVKYVCVGCHTKVDWHSNSDKELCWECWKVHPDYRPPSPELLREIQESLKVSYMENIAAMLNAPTPLLSHLKGCR
jgi:hypothetical protein